MILNTQDIHLDRREMLTHIGKIACLSSLACWPLQAAKILKEKKKPTRSLLLHHTHTGENLKIVYFEKGIYIPSSIKKISHLLRDHYTGEECVMDKRLIDLMHALTQLLDYSKPLNIVSGYRCPKTNRRLRSKSKAVSRNSYHMKGQAVDIAFRGIPLQRASRLARTLKKGGVGYYPRDGFLHVDVRGTPAYWS